MEERRIPGYTGFQPTHVREQMVFPEPEQLHKHIPGYRGYVPGIKAENVYARTFGRTTNDSLDGHIQRGFDLNGGQRYVSTNQSTYVDQRHENKARAETNPFLQGGNL